MKNILVIILCLFISTTFAQRHGGNGQVKWLNIALKGGYGGSMLFNSDISSDGNITQDFLTPSYEFGGRFAIGYGDFISLGVEALTGGFGQEYSIADDNIEFYTKKQTFKSFDLLIALRYTNPYGFYLEAGPKFSTLKSAEVENSINNPRDPNSTDYMLNFSEKFTSIVAGLGFAIYNGDRLQLNVGLRASYALSDFVEDEDFYVVNDNYYTPTGQSTSKTSPFTLKLMLEINYIFGFWGDASCGRGRLMFFQ